MKILHTLKQMTDCFCFPSMVLQVQFLVLNSAAAMLRLLTIVTTHLMRFNVPPQIMIMTEYSEYTKS